MRLLPRFASGRLAALSLWVGAAGVGLVPGCATGPGKQAGPKFIFYPPPPEVPRLQFLVSFSDEKDLGRRVGKFATFVTGEEAPSQPILKPYGVALASNQLCVCDTGARSIGMLDLVQKTMRRFAPPGNATLGVPINLAIDSDGTRYIADSGRNLVLVFGADDTFRGVIGEDNSLRPTGLAVTADRLYVSDLKKHCVRVYEKTSHNPLFTIPRDPEAAEDKEPGKLFMPVNLAIDRQGRIYVSDMAACRVQIYDAEGNYLRSLGSRGDFPGQFARPKGLAVDREDRIYVVDAAAQVCQIFAPDGKLLLYFGEPDGSAAPLDLPAAVTVDYDHVGLFKRYAAANFELDHLVIITNQLGERKISIYGMGHKR